LRSRTRPAKSRGKPITRARTHRVVIVDEHPIVAEWIDRVFGSEADLKVCGLADTCEVAVESIAKHEPDMVIKELALKDRRGAEVVRLDKLNTTLQTSTNGFQS
jgi:DNA-binding NarL/FixJ family response regulator